MTVFKTALKIAKKYKFTILLYAVILVVFTGFNLTTSDNSTNFIETKADVLIINDDDSLLSLDLVSYFDKNANVIDVKNNKQAIDDALFYRAINYIVYIPENFGKQFMDGLDPELEVKATGDYLSSYANMQLERYMRVAKLYLNNVDNEQELIDKINSTVKVETSVEVTSKLDTSSLNKANFYYNFLNYSILAACVYVICLILASFKEEKVRQRTIISSSSYKIVNRQLLISTFVISSILWLFFVLLSFILLGSVMMTSNGLLYILNSFVFNICSIAIAFLIGNIIGNKNAINGIINVVALGSSFLCGTFVPVEFLPNQVLTIAHILPSYWFIKNNETIKSLEVINLESMIPILVNMGIIILFAILFVIITNIITKKKQRIN